MPWFSKRASSAGLIKARRSGGGTEVVRRASYPYNPQWTPDRVMREAMDRVTWVWRCVDAIAGNQANLPLIWRKDDAVSGQPVKNHPMNGVLNSASNMGENSFVFRYRLSSQLLLSSKGVFVEIVRNRMGEVIAMTLLPPQYVTPVPNPRTFVSSYSLDIPGEPHVDLRSDQVIWLRKPHPFDPYRAITPLEAAGVAIESDWLYKLYNRNFLLNDGRPGGLIIVKGLINDDDKEELRARYRGNINTVGRIGVIASQEGADFVDTAITPRDAAYIDGKKATKEEILMAFGVSESVLSNASGRCVDSETEALTQRGWLSGDEITTDDTILSLDPATGRMTWSPIHEIYRAHYSGPMYRLKNKHVDFLVTPGHNWLVETNADQRYKPAKPSGLVLRKVEDLGERDRILVMGEAEDSIKEPTYSTAFVELVGWAVTEGSYDRSAYIRITQNEGLFAERIRCALKESGAHWSEGQQKDQEHLKRFYVRGEIALAITAVSPGKVMTPDFLLSLTSGQREHLLQTMIDADGARQTSTTSWIFTQRDKGAAEAFSMLATLAGYTTSLRYESSGKADFMRWRVIVRQRKHLTLQRNTRTVEHYDGDIWCPRTDYGTFVARRHGRVVTTGNTFDNAEQERLIFWMETMNGNHLPLIERPLDVLDLDPTVFCNFDTSGVDVIQRAEIKRRDFLVKEFNQGLITQNMYLEETGREKLVEGGDTLWIPGTYIPIGSTKKGALEEAKNAIPKKDAPAPGTRPVGRPQDEPMNQDGSDPEPSRDTGDRKPRLVAASAVGALPAVAEPHLYPEQVIPVRLLMVGSEPEPAAPQVMVKLGPWRVIEEQLDAFKEKALDDYMRWETVYERAFQRLFERQHRVVAEKVMGQKMRTWLAKREGWKGTPVFEQVFDQETWDDQLEQDFDPLIAGTMQEFAAEITSALKANAFDVNSDEGLAARKKQILRLILVNRTTRKRVEDELADGAEAGEDQEQLTERVNTVFQDAHDVRARAAAITEVVAAISAGKILGASMVEVTATEEDQGDIPKKTWVTMGDDRVRDTHDEVDGVTVDLHAYFDVGGSAMQFPGDPEGDPEEIVNCRCALLIDGADGPTFA